MIVPAGGTRPIVMMVTDRKRLAARRELAADVDPARVIEILLEQIAEAVEDGVDLVQLRERDLTASELTDLARRARALAEKSATRVVVNDRVDVAVAAGTDGVHLPESGVPAGAARQLIAPPGLVGCSIHAPAPFLQAPIVDYVVFGTVFPTSSKPEAAEIRGLQGLASAVAGSAVPVLAIGGMTLQTVTRVAATGAAGIAAIELFLPAREPSAGVSIRKIVESVHESFDSAQGVS